MACSEDIVHSFVSTCTSTIETPMPFTDLLSCPQSFTVAASYQNYVGNDLSSATSGISTSAVSSMSYFQSSCLYGSQYTAPTAPLNLCISSSQSSASYSTWNPGHCYPFITSVAPSTHLGNIDFHNGAIPLERRDFIDPNNNNTNKYDPKMPSSLSADLVPKVESDYATNQENSDSFFQDRFDRMTSEVTDTNNNFGLDDGGGYTAPQQSMSLLSKEQQSLVPLSDSPFDLAQYSCINNQNALLSNTDKPLASVSPLPTQSFCRKKDAMVSGGEMSSAELVQAERELQRVMANERLRVSPVADNAASNLLADCHMEECPADAAASAVINYTPSAPVPLYSSNGLGDVLPLDMSYDCKNNFATSTPMKTGAQKLVSSSLENAESLMPACMDAKEMTYRLEQLRLQLEAAEEDRRVRRAAQERKVYPSGGVISSTTDPQIRALTMEAMEILAREEGARVIDENIEIIKSNDGSRPRRFRCMHCPYESTKLYNVQRHTRKHTDTMIRCVRCGSLFYEKYRLDEHIRIVHDGERLVCEYCGKMFSSKSGLGAHVRSAHEGTYRFRCEFCQKKFQSPSHYLGHMNRHFNIRPYVCVMCNKGFTQRSQMKAHALICQKEKEYKCELCDDASFKTKKYLLEHYRGKHSDRGYTCACGRKYPWRTSFKRHYQQCWASRITKKSESDPVAADGSPQFVWNPDIALSHNA